MIRALRILWIIASIAMLIVTLLFYNPTLGRDADLLMVYGMLFLCFPSGFLVAGLFASLAILEESLKIPFLNMDYGSMSIFIIWFCFFVVGYIQWFKLLPFLIDKWQSRQRGNG